MEVFFMVLLGLSIAGLCAILLLKRWELESGRVALRSVRPAAGAALAEVLLFVEAKAPALFLRGVREFWSTGRAFIHRATAWAVLHAERLLERVLHMLRGATHPGSSSQASEFLREVAEHKRSLIKKASRRKKPNAIYEE